MQLSGKKIICYTDGSVMKNPGEKGAWAFIAIDEKKVIQMKCGITLNEDDTLTSISMELNALEECLKYCVKKLQLKTYKNYNFLIYTDSQYLKTMFYRDRDLLIKSHKDRWLKVYKLCEKYKNIDVEWVRGHSNSVENILVDNIMRKMYKAIGINIGTR